MAPSAHQGVARAKELLAQIERLAHKSAAQGGEVDCVALGVLLDEALDNLASRQILVAYLAAFLARCVSGSVPDYRDWHPPLS